MAQLLLKFKENNTVLTGPPKELCRYLDRQCRLPRPLYTLPRYLQSKTARHTDCGSILYIVYKMEFLNHLLLNTVNTVLFSNDFNENGTINIWAR